MDKSSTFTNSLTWNYKSREGSNVVLEEEKYTQPNIFFQELVARYDNIIDFNMKNIDISDISDKI